MTNQVRNILTPQTMPFESFDNGEAAWQQLLRIYERNCNFIRAHFLDYTAQKLPQNQAIRAFYPLIRIRLTHHTISTHAFLMALLKARESMKQR